MSQKRLLPTAPLVSVQGDTPTRACIKLMRESNLGALVVLGNKQEIIGIFTERDLVKHFEVLEKGKSWDTPVRSVMTTGVRTLSVEKISQAPRLMVEHNIRHLPIVSLEEGSQKIVGVISMRDLFRASMEAIDFDLNRLFSPLTPKRPVKARKLIGVFSSDPGVLDLVDQGVKLTQHFLVKSITIDKNLETLEDFLSRFDALVVDLDGLPAVQFSKLINYAKHFVEKRQLFFLFSPAALDGARIEALREVGEKASVRLFSKPIALGLIVERLLRPIR